MRNAGRFLAVAVVQGLVGWLASKTLDGAITSPELRDWALVAIWPLVIISGTVAFAVWVWKGEGRGSSLSVMIPTQYLEPDMPMPVVPTAKGQRGERQVVNVSPSYLLGLFDNHTSMEAGRLMADFIGKWMAVSGEVQDVSQHADRLYVQIRDSKRRLVGMTFKGRWKDQASTLRRGDRVDAVGRIADASGMSLTLDDAEFRVSSQSSNPAIS